MSGNIAYKDRIKATERFNTKGSPFGVYLTSVPVASSGLDLRNDCHHGILIQYPWSINRMTQIVGRLTRLGQTRKVIWEVVNCAVSFMVCYSTDDAAQEPTCIFHDMFMHEVMTMTVGFMYNRYTLHLFPPRSTADIYCLRYRELGCAVGKISCFVGGVKSLMLHPPRRWVAMALHPSSGVLSTIPPATHEKALSKFTDYRSIMDKGPLGLAPTELPFILSTEEPLHLPSFTSDDAFALGTHLRTRLRYLYPHHPALISISHSSGQLLFLASSSPGTSPDNHVWVARKRATVMRFGVSSWYMSRKFDGDEGRFAAKYGLGERAADYAIHGGAVPVKVKGVEGPVGVVVVSGLKQDADHMAAVEGLAWLKEELEGEGKGRRD